MVEKLSQACIQYAKSKGVSFSYKSKDLSLEEVFASFGILPGIVKRASKLSSLCIGSSLGESLPKKEKSYLGYELKLTDSNLPVPLMMLFIVDVLESVIGKNGKGAVVSLDEFSYE